MGLSRRSLTLSSPSRCTTEGESLTTLIGHRKDGHYRGLNARHARLAVASAVAFIDFVSETYQYRQHSEGDKKAPLKALDQVAV